METSLENARAMDDMYETLTPQAVLIVGRIKELLNINRLEGTAIDRFFDDCLAAEVARRAGRPLPLQDYATCLADFVLESSVRFRYRQRLQALLAALAAAL